MTARPISISRTRPSSWRARTATAARCMTRITTAGNRASALPTAPASAGCSAAATPSRSTWKAPAPTCGCRSIPPFFFESEVRYDATSGAGNIATGFVGLQALDRPSGQVRAWDPNLRPQFTQQWNFFTEYLLGSRSSINIGYVGNWSTQLVTPIDGNQPLPGTGDPATWLPVQQRRPLYPFNPLITSISTTASRGRVQLQRAAVDVQAAAVERAGLRRQLHVEQVDGEQLRLLRQRRRGRRGRLPAEQLRHRGQLRTRRPTMRGTSSRWPAATTCRSAGSGSSGATGTGGRCGARGLVAPASRRRRTPASRSR